jgi:hypothetical protein
MTQEILASHIGYLYNEHKEYAVKIKDKLNLGIACQNQLINLRNAFYGIQELENYYTDCSCLEETDLCDIIHQIKNLLN